MSGVDSSGLIALQTRLDALSRRVGITALGLLDARADLMVRTFARDTPHGKTDKAAAGWRKAPISPGMIAVINEVRSRRGFAYPSALVTGTGARGQFTTGYLGAFANGWPGMAPAAKLHADWQFFTTQPFLTGAFLTGTL